MKSSISTSTTLKLVLVFTLLFAAFLAVAITYNKAYRMKNESISIIEKYEGVSNISIDILNNFLRTNGYNTEGPCEEGEYGSQNLDNTELSRVNANDRRSFYYCLKSRCAETHCRANSTNHIYYTIKLFFKFDLPLFSNITLFRITGETKGIYVNTKIDTLS